MILVVFENKSYEHVIGQRSAPTINALARRYALLTNYYALAHPSLPNYLALVSGSTHNVKNDCINCNLPGRTLADTLEAKDRTWKLYAEGLPVAGFEGANSGRYTKSHVPFMYFRTILAREDRVNRIVPFKEFRSDLTRGKLADFSFVVPDRCNIGHDCPLSTADSWLRRFLQPLLSGQRLSESVVFVTFDEDDSEKPKTSDGGHIATLVLGPLVRPHTRSAARLDHYSLLRTIEDAWGLTPLGRSASAKPIRGIWR